MDNHCFVLPEKYPESSSTGLKIIQFSTKDTKLLKINENFERVSILTFFERPFFFLVMRSMSSKRMTNISGAFPESRSWRGPSIRICLARKVKWQQWKWKLEGSLHQNLPGKKSESDKSESESWRGPSIGICLARKSVQFLLHLFIVREFRWIKTMEAEYNYNSVKGFHNLNPAKQSNYHYLQQAVIFWDVRSNQNQCQKSLIVFLSFLICLF